MSCVYDFHLGKKIDFLNAGSSNLSLFSLNIHLESHSCFVFFATFKLQYRNYFTVRHIVKCGAISRWHFSKICSADFSTSNWFCHILSRKQKTSLLTYFKSKTTLENCQFGVASSKHEKHRNASIQKMAILELFVNKTCYKTRHVVEQNTLLDETYYNSPLYSRLNLDH